MISTFLRKSYIITFSSNFNEKVSCNCGIYQHLLSTCCHVIVFILKVKVHFILLVSLLYMVANYCILYFHLYHPTALENMHHDNICAVIIGSKLKIRSKKCLFFMVILLNLDSCILITKIYHFFKQIKYELSVEILNGK